MKPKQNIAQITEFEFALVRNVRHATFAVGHAHKRFIRDILPVSLLSDRGRWYLAFIAHRYRRQYRLTTEQIAWVNDWLSKEINEPKPDSVPVPMEPHEPERPALPSADKGQAQQLPCEVRTGWLFGGDEPECLEEG